MTEKKAETSNDVIERIMTIVSREGMIDRDQLSMERSLESLEVESADMMMILMAIEEEFGVYIPVDESLSEADTVGELVHAISAHIGREGDSAGK